MLKLQLPYPPSINHYWRRAGNRTIISREGREYRRRVVQLLSYKHIDPLLGELSVEVQVAPPDRRRRDIDNVLKALLDGLQHGGAYADDYQIARLLVERIEPTKKGRTIVTIRELRLPDPENTSRKFRSCLKCQTEFVSSGPGNRICSKCALQNAELGPHVPITRGEKRLNGDLI